MQPVLLVSIELRQAANGRVLYSFRHAFGLATPNVISHVIDVAVAAVQVAPAGYFEQYGVNHVNRHDRSGFLAAIMPPGHHTHFLRSIIGVGEDKDKRSIDVENLY